jgi:hypothetical protein
VKLHRVGLVLSFLLAPVVASAQPGPCGVRPVTIGINVQGEPDLDLVRAAKTGWIRINLRWSEVNPAPGVWRFAAIDRQVRQARDRDLEILALLAHAPEWLGGGRNGTTPPADVSRWSEFVTRTAERYRGRIAAYEIWNEPDFRDEGDGIGWNRDLEQVPHYVDYLRAAAEAIRTRAPGTKVVGPALASGISDRKRALLRQLEGSGAAELLDALSVHQNIQGDDGPGPWLVRLLGNNLYPLEELAPSLAAKPIWVTEFGWRSTAVGESNQRAHLAGALALMTGGADFPACANVGRFAVTHGFIYKLIDSPEETSGLFRVDLSPKPAVSDYLARLPFPAREGGVAPVGMRVDCDELDCRFEQDVFDDPGPWRCRWSFGDGAVAPRPGRKGRFDPRDCRPVEHTFDRPGVYPVELTLELGELRLTGLATHRPTCLDSTPPRVAFRGPVPTTAAGTLRLEAQASDDRALRSVELYAGGKFVARILAPGPYGFDWNTRRSKNGPVEITLKATDTCGNTTFSTSRQGRVEVVVGNGS